MALAINKQLKWYEGDKDHHPVKAGVHIFRSAATSLDANGMLRPLLVADANFAGMAVEEYINDAAGAVDGGVPDAEVVHSKDMLLKVTGLAAGSFGSAVYAHDDDSFDLVAAAGVRIGTVARVHDVAKELARVTIQRTQA